MSYSQFRFLELTLAWLNLWPECASLAGSTKYQIDGVLWTELICRHCMTKDAQGGLVRIHTRLTHILTTGHSVCRYSTNLKGFSLYKADADLVPRYIAVSLIYSKILCFTKPFLYIRESYIYVTFMKTYYLSDLSNCHKFPESSNKN